MITRKPKSGIPIQYRQGDVYLIEAALPPEARVQPRPQERLVLEYGEVTGHAHAIYETEAANLYLAGAKRYLEMCLAAPLRHEEHSQIPLEEKKCYEVLRAHTWSVLTQLARQVTD